MKIRNRNSDVVSLRCHVCQDFLKMVIIDGWREPLESFLQLQMKSKYRDNYIEQYKIMRKKGIDNYTIDDMDVPFISNIIYYCPKITNVTNQTSKALYYLKQDRHDTNHSSENEPDEELYLRALISLKDLQNFLFTVDINEEQIPKNQRSQFIKKYSKEIDDLKLLIYNDCIELFQIKKDVSLILSREDPDKVFHNAVETYMKRSRLSQNEKAVETRFCIEASNAGIKSAHGYAAIQFENLKDYSEATRRYEMLIQSYEKLSISDARNIISFINIMKMKNIEITDRMLNLVSAVKEHGFDIVETEKGFILKKN